MDLVTNRNTQLVLDADQPDPALSAAHFARPIERLTDLVDLGLTTKTSLNAMLTAARESTQDALGRPGRPVFVPGTRRPDLQRYSGYLNRLSGQSDLEKRAVWTTLRTLNPATLARLKIDDVLRIPGWVFKGFLFDDVTVTQGSTLVVAPSTTLLTARHIVIEKSAQIVVKGTSLAIRATSIQGQ